MGSTGATRAVGGGNIRPSEVSEPSRVLVTTYPKSIYVTVGGGETVSDVLYRDADEMLSNIRDALGGSLPATSTDYGRTVYEALAKLYDMYRSGAEFKGRWGQDTLKRMRLELYGRMTRDAQSAIRSIDYESPREITPEMARFYSNKERYEKIVGWLNTKIV